MTLPGHIPLWLGPSWAKAEYFIIATQDTVLFKNCMSYDHMSKVRKGDIFIAESHPKTYEGWSMVRVHGGGAVQTDCFRPCHIREERVINPNLLVLTIGKRSPKTNRQGLCGFKT